MHGPRDLSELEAGAWDGADEGTCSVLFDNSASSIALAKPLNTDAAFSSSSSSSRGGLEGLAIGLVIEFDK